MRERGRKSLQAVILFNACVLAINNVILLSTLFHNLKNKTMNQTKTAVIIGIVCVVLLGALLYANRDKFSSEKSVETTNQTPAE